MECWRDMFSVGPDIVLHRPRWQLHSYGNRELKLYSRSIGDGVVLTNAMVVGGAKAHYGTIVLYKSCILKGEEPAAHKLYADATMSCIGVA